MILWLSIGIVIIGCGGLALALFRKRRKHDPLALTGTVMAVLALIFGCGVAIQQYVDNERDSAISARRDELMIALADVLAQIQREMIRTDISPLARQERLAILLQRYDRIRAAIAETSGVRPAPALSIPLTTVPAMAAPPTNETATGEPDTAARTATRPREAPAEDVNPAAVAPASIPPPPVTAPPPPPPPPF